MIGTPPLLPVPSTQVVRIHTRKPEPKAPPGSPEPQEVSHASAAGPRPVPAQTATEAGNTALRDRQSQILEPIDFAETVGGLRCLAGLHIGSALGTAAAATIGTLSGMAGGIDQIDADAPTVVMGLIAGGVGLIAGALIPVAIDWVALRARRACAGRCPRPPSEAPARSPTQLLQDIEALAQRGAPLTAEGVRSCLLKIQSLLEVPNNGLTSQTMAQTYVHIAQSACRPSACGGSVGHAIEGVDLVAKGLAYLRREHDLSAQTFRASMVVLAMTLSAHRLSLKSAKEAAHSLLSAFWSGTESGRGERRERLNFFTLLRGLPGFERVGRPGSTLSRIFNLDELATWAQVSIGIASLLRPSAMGIDARTCIDQFLRANHRDRCPAKLADNSDRLFIGLARLGPLQVPPDLAQALRKELHTPPSEERSITGAQQRVLDLLSGTLGQHPEQEDEPREADWHRAPFEVLLALTRYARRFPENQPLQDLVARTTAPGRITDRLSRADLEQLPVLIEHAIDFAGGVPQEPTQKVLLLHSILTHLAGRHTLGSDSFIAGVESPEDLIEVLSEVNGQATPTDDARHLLSQQVAALPRLCQLQSTPALLRAAWGAINRIWGHREAAQGDRRTQERFASAYRAQAREQVNRRILPERSIPELGPQESLNLHWLRAPMADLPIGPEAIGTGAARTASAEVQAIEVQATPTAAAAGPAPSRRDHGGTAHSLAEVRSQLGKPR